MRRADLPPRDPNPVPLRRAPALLAAVLLLPSLACGGRERAATGDVAEWSLEPAPIVAIGDRADADSMLLANVSDARLLANGIVAIADAGANRVLFFDTTGREISRVGRRGRGPGEFAGLITLTELGTDTVAVWDPSQGRWTVLSARTGRFSAPSDSVKAPTILHAGLQVQTDLKVPPAWALRALTARSAASTEIRVGHVDDRGLLWVSQDAGLKRWEVFADTGGPVARLAIPENLRALHFTRGAVIGLASDSTGLEQVVVHRIRATEVPQVDLTPAAPLVVSDSARYTLMSVMRNSVTLQEMNYAIKGSYTIHADSLNFRPDPGIRLKILEATDRGWRGVAWFTETGYTCAMVVGLTVPPGSMEGAPKCGW